MFTVLVSGVSEVPEVPQNLPEIRTDSPLDQVVNLNEFKAGRLGLSLEDLLQTRLYIQTETKLRLHHTVSKDGVVTFHFCGQIQKKKRLRQAYLMLLNTLCERSIITVAVYSSYQIDTI